MSVRRPLKSLLGSANTLREMTDVDLERLTYEVRKAYAVVPTAAGKGHINIGAAGVAIGSALDTKRTQALTTGDGGYPDASDAGHGPASDWPAPGSTGTTNVTTYNYKQNRDVNTPFASTSDLDLYSYYISTGVSDGDLTVKLEEVEANIVDTIISDCITEMATGDEVGTYRVHTAAPTSGGAGTWANKGSFLLDTIYGATYSTWILWLKTDLTTPPTEIKPVGRSGTAMKELDVSSTGNLVQKILLPALQNRHDNSQLNYHVQTSTGYTNRGIFYNSHRSGTTTYYDGPSGDTYTTRVDPTGAGGTNQNTYYLNLQT